MPLVDPYFRQLAERMGLNMQEFEAGFNTNCPDCQDTGIYQINQCTGTMPDGTIMTANLDQERVCNCQKGKEVQEVWIKENCWACSYGSITTYEKKPDGREVRVISFCPHCETGKSYQEKLAKIVAARWQEKLSKLMTDSQLQEDCSFDNFITAGQPELVRALDHARETAAIGNSLFLYGKSGRGKSHLSMGYLRQWVESGRGGIFATMPQILLTIQDTFNNNNSGTSQKEVLDRYINADLLVIDDLGKEKISIFTCQTLFNLLDGRKNKVTVISSNCSLEDLQDLMITEAGMHPTRVDPIISRLSGFDIMTWQAPDYRLVKARARQNS